MVAIFFFSYIRAEIDRKRKILMHNDGLVKEGRITASLLRSLIQLQFSKYIGIYISLAKCIVKTIALYFFKDLICIKHVFMKSRIVHWLSSSSNFYKRNFSVFHSYSLLTKKSRHTFKDVIKKSHIGRLL